MKRSKRIHEESGSVATTNETTMERLIEKMMVDLDADSDEDSNFTVRFYILLVVIRDLACVVWPSECSQFSAQLNCSHATYSYCSNTL